MLGTTIGSPTRMMVEVELIEKNGPNTTHIERIVLPVGGQLDYHEFKTNEWLATIKITSIFQGKYESSSNNEQSVSEPERLSGSPEIPGDEATDIQS